MRCSASGSEAVHRWFGTFAKEVCVTVPGLHRTTSHALKLAQIA
jgi:hypothetical protein